MTDLRPYMMADDPLLTGILMAALIIVLVSVALCMTTIRLQIQSAFAPITSRKGSDCARMQATAAGRTLMWMSIVGCAIGVFVLVAYIIDAMPSTDYALPAIIYSQQPIILLAAMAFLILALTARRMMYGMVNWTFFPTESIRRWNCVYRLKSLLDAVLILLGAQVVVCNSLPVNAAIIIGISAAIPGLLLLIWGSWRLFFGNLLGCLHFLLYLCTLELLTAFLVVFGQIEITMYVWGNLMPIE